MCGPTVDWGETRWPVNVDCSVHPIGQNNESATATRDYHQVLACAEAVFAILFKASCQREIRVASVAAGGSAPDAVLQQVIGNLRFASSFCTNGLSALGDYSFAVPEGDGCDHHQKSRSDRGKDTCRQGRCQQCSPPPPARKRKQKEREEERTQKPRVPTRLSRRTELDLLQMTVSTSRSHSCLFAEMDFEGTHFVFFFFGQNFPHQLQRLLPCFGDLPHPRASTWTC